jgi:hypothetical protein
MYATVSSYSSTSLVVNVTAITGTGTFSSWTIDNIYAGGGGGGGYNFGSGGVGGAGGGATGASSPGSSQAPSPVPNTGGGGGGGNNNGGAGGSYGSPGADGVVVISYPTTFSPPSGTTGSPTSGIVNGYYVYIWTGNGSITF